MMNDVISGRISVEVDSSVLGKVCYTFAYSTSGDTAIVTLQKDNDTMYPLQHVMFGFDKAVLKSCCTNTVDEIMDRLELLISKHVYQELEEIPGEIKGVVVDRGHGLHNWANYLKRY